MGWAAEDPFDDLGERCQQAILDRFRILLQRSGLSLSESGIAGLIEGSLRGVKPGDAASFSKLLWEAIRRTDPLAFTRLEEEFPELFFVVQFLHLVEGRYQSVLAEEVFGESDIVSVERGSAAVSALIRVLRSFSTEELEARTHCYWSHANISHKLERARASVR